MARLCGTQVTYCCLQTGHVWVIGRSVSEDLSQQQRVFYQTWTRDVKEAPEVQLSAEGWLQTALQEILHPPVLLFLVQQGFGGKLVAAVDFVGVQTGQLREKQSEAKHLHGALFMSLKKRKERKYPKAACRISFRFFKRIFSFLKSILNMNISWWQAVKF